MSLSEIESNNVFIMLRDTKEDCSAELLSLMKDLLHSNSYLDVERACLGLMGSLCLGKLKKGPILFETKVQSFQQCWMGAKKTE